MKEPSSQKLSITGRMSQAGADRVGYLWAVAGIIVARGRGRGAWGPGLGVWGGERRQKLCGARRAASLFRFGYYRHRKCDWGAVVSDKEWTYMLRIPSRAPDDFRMDRLALYMSEFAKLLGVENSPTFAGIKNASTGLLSCVPYARRRATWVRVQKAKRRIKGSAVSHLNAIESMMGEDGLSGVQLLDNKDNVVYLFQAKVKVEMVAMTVRQHGQLDGVVTGLRGADDTMHLYVRDQLNRDHRLVVRNEALARDIVHRFRSGLVRIRLYGSWIRTEDGWIPESGKCVVEGYEVLDDTPLAEVMASIAAIPNNGWRQIEDPDAVWRELRGIH